jgi:hypothetical protein
VSNASTDRDVLEVHLVGVRRANEAGEHCRNCERAEGRLYLPGLGALGASRMALLLGVDWTPKHVLNVVKEIFFKLLAATR